MPKEIQLTKGFYAIVDDEDFEYLNQFKWYAAYCAKNKIYARRIVNRKAVYMHRFITNAPDNAIVDHKNGSSLDNRRLNLHVGTHHDNMVNRITNWLTKGTSFHKQSGLWRARVVSHRVEYTNYFKTDIEAIHGYNALALKHHGDSAKLNHYF